MIDWNASSDATWLELTPAGGTLEAGGTTEVGACVIREAADQLGGGLFRDAIWISGDDASHPVQVALSMTQYQRGDVNADHAVDLSDLLLLLEHILRVEALPIQIVRLELADPNLDGSIDVCDLVTVANQIVGDFAGDESHGEASDRATGGEAGSLFASQTDPWLRLVPDHGLPGTAGTRLVLGGEGGLRAGIVRLSRNGGNAGVRWNGNESSPFHSVMAETASHLAILFYSVENEPYRLAADGGANAGADDGAVNELEIGTLYGETLEDLELVAALAGRAAGNLLVISIDPQAGAPVSAAAAAPILRSIHPNPCVDRARITFALSSPAEVRLAVYGPAGRLIRPINLGLRGPGVHHTIWSGTDAAGRPLPAGVYFIKLVAPGATSTRRVVILR